MRYKKGLEPKHSKRFAGLPNRLLTFAGLPNGSISSQDNAIWYFVQFGFGQAFKCVQKQVYFNEKQSLLIQYDFLCSVLFNTVAFCSQT